MIRARSNYYLSTLTEELNMHNLIKIIEALRTNQTNHHIMEKRNINLIENNFYMTFRSIYAVALESKLKKKKKIEERKYS